MKTRTTPNGSSLTPPPTDSEQQNPDPSTPTDDPTGLSTMQTERTRAAARGPLSIVRKPQRSTQIVITLQEINPGRPKHTSARVLTLDTQLAPKECLALLQVISNLLKAYQPKERTP